MDKLEPFKAWIDSEFSDCSWYFEAQENKYLHLYREDSDDFWSYEETVAWLTWQSRQAELDQQKLLTGDSELHLDAAKEEIERLKGVVDEKDKRIEVLENRIEEGLGFIDKFHCEGWLSDLDNAEKALRGEHE